MAFWRFVPALLVLTGVFGGVGLLYWFRASAMRNLALKRGFRYAKGDPLFWRSANKYRLVPASLRLKGYPANTLRQMWNVLEGEINGAKVLIFDSILGMGVWGRGQRYSTFLAVEADRDPFEGRSPKEKTTHGNGWFVLYCFRFWQVPWTLSIEAIEERLDKLKP